MTEKPIAAISSVVLFLNPPTADSYQKCPLSGKDAPEVTYKNPQELLKYVSRKGRILPPRLTKICAKKQAELTIAVKRARALALLPYSAD